MTAAAHDPALWLALAPSWTGESALATGFPAADPGDEQDYFDRLGELVHHWEQRGVAQRNGTLKPDQLWLTEFWHTTAQRRAVLEAAVSMLGGPALAAEARLIAGRLQALDLDVPLDPVMRNWIDLAITDGAGHPERRFLDRVRELCRSYHVSEAQAHITAAEIFEPVARPAFGEAVEAARRLVRLANRRAHDRHSLREYQPRSAWTAELRTLLNGDGREWAMHLIGTGGTGKTSFVRYVASGDFAEHTGLPQITVGRVDFDLLSPEYPARRPAHLLTEFAHELASEVRTGAAEEARAEFYRLAYVADEATGPAGVVATADALRAFVRFLTELSGRVLLILDTCEELSRADPAGAPDAAVAATFEVLAAVHRGLPSVRVLLCGRRPMEPGSGVSMRTVRARGFNEEEATRYLTRPDDGVVMPASLVEAILTLSPEHAEPPDRSGRRFSPFDVRLYRQWWASEKDITDEQLRLSGRSAYVQERIVGRLTQRWSVGALPAVALLGTFDGRTLESVIRDQSDVEAVIAEFARQDWIDARPDPAGEGQVLEVHASMLPLLRVWAHGLAEEKLATVRRNLAVALGAQLETRPLEQLSVANVVSAIRLAAPVVAVRLWERLEARMGTAGDWAWMSRLCPRVLGALAEAKIPEGRRRDGEPEGTEPPDDLLLAAVRATAVAVAARSGAAFDRAGEWRAVLRLVGDRTGWAAERLRLRARLGVLAATAREAMAAPDAVAETTTLIRDTLEHERRLTGGVVAVIEAIAEVTEAGPRLEPIAAAVHDWLPVDTDPVTTICARLAVYRLTQGGPEHPLDVRDLDRAAREAPVGVDPWPDWIAPPSVLIRLNLHLAARAYLSGAPLRELPLQQWERDAEARSATVDSDRLLSVCLHLRLGHGTVARDHLDRLRPLAGPTDRAVPRLRVHRLIPPLFQSLGYAYLVLGDIGSAQRMLDSALGRAHEQGDEEATRSAAAGLLWLSRRMRRTLPAGLPEQAAPDLAGREWAARALTDGTPPPPGSARESIVRWHHHWQALSVDPRTATVTLPPLPEQPGPVGPGLRELLVADLREAAAGGAGADAEQTLARVRVLPTAEPDDPVAAAPLDAMHLELAVATPAKLDRFREANPAHPPLFVAVAALELGEQRALRDPVGAKPLLNLAAGLSESRSPVLAFQAATLAALAHVHGGADHSDLTTRSLVLGLNIAYTRMREHLGGELPEWAALTGAPPDPDHPWFGWLIRLRVAITALAGRSGHGPPTAPAVRSVELYPTRFGAVAETVADRGGAKFVVPRLDGSDRLRLSLVAMQARFRRIPRLTVQVLPRPRKLVLSTGRERWRGAAGMGPFGAVRMGAGDAVPDLSASMRAMAGENPPRLWRLVLQLGDQVRFWEAEITERLGLPDDAVMPRWYRAWPLGVAAVPAAPSEGRPDGPPVRVLEGGVGRNHSEVRFVDQVTRQIMTPADMARLNACAIVLRTTTPVGEEPANVRDIDALRLAVRCMAAGVRNLLLLPQPSPEVADRIADRAADLNDRPGRPRAMDLMALADSARDSTEPSRGQVVLFLRGEPDDGTG
ncbi:hypothetical protein GCM10010112_41070 [Actinoplanes lobatus]|uniref:Uncharacterized protein n=1 Tax=Actinoplanes lobatus TaxID=113568 RepID=A0A7W7HNH1_9ACTN|nr:hypothetical protein [Actinoplanes lobatus]MBB4753778.1 hypothetical protein [Actinoplanes lobatus]GGN72560.1 hypothetical protein GCM10010112_41070 [Actinoplanes lobatus]GIE42069.1 hypothetical protein Alo02nite_49670 [Actinoplanes lobatus]